MVIQASPANRGRVNLQHKTLKFEIDKVPLKRAKLLKDVIRARELTIGASSTKFWRSMEKNRVVFLSWSSTANCQHKLNAHASCTAE